MGWSTREVAQLAGTTLRAVRHYHEVGLLDLPERQPNGYKRYRTEHLVRLIQIRRLTELGIPLARIPDVQDEPELFEKALAEADAELALTIAQLQKARKEIAELRRRPVSTDLPVDLSAAATKARLSPADRSLFAVITQVIGATNSQHWADLLRDYERDEADDEFDRLPPDADEETREGVARRMAPQIQALLEKHPTPPHPAEHAALGQQTAANAVVSAMLDLYNPAQLDVFVRVWKAAGLI